MKLPSVEYEKLILSTECDNESNDDIIKNISIKTKLSSEYYRSKQKIVSVYILFQIINNMYHTSNKVFKYNYPTTGVMVSCVYMLNSFVCLALLWLGSRKKKYERISILIAFLIT